MGTEYLNQEENLHKYRKPEPEIKDALKKMKNGKAMESDRICIERW